MGATRVAFDPELPFTVSTGFVYAGKRYEALAPFPWRELGMTEVDLLDLYQAGDVDCVPRDLIKVEAPQPKRKRTAQQPAG